MSAVRLHDAVDESRFGGKAVQLGASLRASLPVPDGFALDHVFVASVVAGDATALARVAEVHASLGGGRVAARSSAVGEDGASASFAGQHLTRLAVATLDALVDAIGAVHASGHADSALAYRRKRGIAGTPRVGVVVQRMIDADCAGVLFSRCPLTGEDVRVIEGAWGLGESVVSGLVDPDRFRVARGGRVIERAVADKPLAIRARPDGDTHEVPVAAPQRGQACLDDAMLAALDVLATRCDAVFDDGRPHDIEWAFERGRLALLQRRAITHR